MLSSEDEFLLLLKKWRSESTVISVLGNIDGHLHLCLVGTIAHIDEEEKSCSITCGQSFALIDYGGCTFGYSAIEDSADELKKFALTFGHKYEEAVGLKAPAGAHITLAAVPR